MSSVVSAPMEIVLKIGQKLRRWFTRAGVSPKRLFAWAEKRRPLVVILILYVLITLLHSFITPAFEAPDEIGHFEYMVFIAQRHCLPTVQDHGHISEISIVLHPPLYYCLGALVLSAMHPFDMGVQYPYQFDLGAFQMSCRKRLSVVE